LHFVILCVCHMKINHLLTYLLLWCLPTTQVFIDWFSQKYITDHPSCFTKNRVLGMTAQNILFLHRTNCRPKKFVKWRLTAEPTTGMTLFHQIYSGAALTMQCRTIRVILKFILLLIGSQWRSSRTRMAADMLLNLKMFKTSQAAKLVKIANLA